VGLRCACSTVYAWTFKKIQLEHYSTSHINSTAQNVVRLWFLIARLDGQLDSSAICNLHVEQSVLHHTVLYCIGYSHAESLSMPVGPHSV
jgi:hypothetical protein